MANNFRTIYLYIVALITLGMIIGGIVSTVNNTASYFYPTSYVFFEESEKYNSTDNYESTRNNLIKRDNYKREKIKNAIVSVAVVGVGIVMYKYHWKIIEKERVK